MNRRRFFGIFLGAAAASAAKPIFTAAPPVWNPPPLETGLTLEKLIKAWAILSEQEADHKIGMVMLKEDHARLTEALRGPCIIMEDISRA